MEKGVLVFILYRRVPSFLGCLPSLLFLGHGEEALGILSMGLLGKLGKWGCTLTKRTIAKGKEAGVCDHISSHLSCQKLLIFVLKWSIM